MTMTLVRWDPIRELASMEVDRLNRMFTDFYGGLGHSWVPAVDVYETDNHEFVLKAELPEIKREDVDIYETGEKEVVLKAELPGLKREDIDLTVENNTLTIRGVRRQDDGIAEAQYHRSERVYGACSRSFTLPNTVDPSRVKAEYRDG